jgi:Ni,Fe-hydrogenase I cytochrome b subunit
MTDPSVIQHDKNMLHRWFGTNRGTHWTVASSVMVIILGGYFIYSSRDSKYPSGDSTPAVEQTQVPTSPPPRN